MNKIFIFDTLFNLISSYQPKINKKIHICFWRIWALWKRLKKREYTNIIAVSHKDEQLLAQKFIFGFPYNLCSRCHRFNIGNICCLRFNCKKEKMEVNKEKIWKTITSGSQTTDGSLIQDSMISCQASPVADLQCHLY